MHRTISLSVVGRASLALLIAVAFLQPRVHGAAQQKDAQPKDAQQDPQEPVISKMRVQDFPGQHYFYIATETTIPQLGNVVPQAMGAMMQAIKENHVEITNPGIFVYHGATHDPNKSFKLEMGFPVAEGTKEMGEYKIRELEPFHCASVIYSGPIAQIPQAYQQAFSEVMAAGLQPTGETREMYLYWEGIDSPNNVQIIMIGVAK